MRGRGLACHQGPTPETAHRPLTPGPQRTATPRRRVYRRGRGGFRKGQFGGEIFVLQFGAEIATIGCGQNMGECRPVAKFPFSQSRSSTSKIHQRDLRERWRGCGKMGKMRLEKTGNLSHFSPIFLLFPPNFTQFLCISHDEFSAVCRNSPFPPISPHFPPFPPISPHFPPFFHSPHFPSPLRLVG